MHYTTDFLLSQHANYWIIKDMMGFIVHIPLWKAMCWNRADLEVPLPVPDPVSSGCPLPDTLLKLSVVPQKAGLVLSFRKDVCLWQEPSDSVEKQWVRGARSLQKPWPGTGDWAMGTGALSVLAGISFHRSCSWHSGPPQADCNEVLFPD